MRLAASLMAASPGCGVYPTGKRTDPAGFHQPNLEQVTGNLPAADTKGQRDHDPSSPSDGAAEGEALPLAMKNIRCDMGCNSHQRILSRKKTDEISLLRVYQSNG